MKADEMAQSDSKGMGGFSLLEILVAITAITVVATGVLGVTGHVSRAAAAMQQKMVAVHLIDKMLAEAKKDNGRSLQPGTSAVAEVRELKHGAMTRTVEILESDPDLKQVTIRIGWDYPWKEGENKPCVQCDKQETVTTVFYAG
ncbi:MAG TPA: type II secretion system protein [Candidatus Omnitrophota bacterium]|jgi:type II secretion system protein I|nr:MAG: hypothetical protein BWY49_00512 [Candidatus Omnitrophica bacterium ADurb.Bin314]HOE68851.1 type II secretion system protein [Candidatus Omnitrophota bacterium]HQB94292.1 type II secretion system protein [Candidatus Omnitrophota bacterium]